MKRKVVISLLLCGMLMASSAEAQKIKFGRYFEDATLRIKYQRVGSKKSDTIRMVQQDRIGQWSGSLTQLIDPFNNGFFRIVVQDAQTGRRLYSRGYNSLFAEYRDTPIGADSVAAFEEVVRVPWPKVPVNICWEELGSDRRYHTQYTLYCDPLQLMEQLLKRSDISVSLDPIRLHYKGDVHRKIDVVIVPEGYGPADTTKMRTDMERFCTYLLQQEPFASRRNDFNVWGVALTGEESGITNPGKGLYVKSLVGASFNTFGADRYMMTMKLFQLHDAIGSTPCDHIIIMANSDTYGGGGIYNFYAMSSLNKMAYMVLPHELGHSIGGLADEYVDEDLSYGETHSKSFEPMEPNITSLVEFGMKWESMLPPGTPVPTPENATVPRTENGPLGVYEGAGYQSKGLFRPAQHCMMRDYAPFCPVCAKRLNAVFDLYTK